MPVITLLRGFKVHVGVLDRFLENHGFDETFGIAPVYPKYDTIATFLSTLMGAEGSDKGARLIIPARESFDQATYGYIAYCWVHTFAQREINMAEELSESAPPGFEKLRDEILKFDTREKFEEKNNESGKTGLFQVFTYNRSWKPKSGLQIREGRSSCDQCDQVFDSFVERQEHRQEVHESREGAAPVPDC
ncbi:hypothetical protein F5Y16DRAFT_389720 [Xylariaceae sp. FL0255]|nr:hypothetical protein F5Y16DRAFT_389720 [Xylariaceae sp. FL0255]